MSPIISNIFFDTQFFVGLDAWLCGLYVRAHAPIVHTRWDLRLREESIKSKECTPFPACYMDSNEVKATCSLKQALGGSFTFGQLDQPLEFGKFPRHALTKSGVSNVDLAVGWDFLKCENYHLGIFAIAIAPTGNKPKNHFIFEPIVGNAKRTEVGGGVSGHLVLWDEGPDQMLGIYFEGYITHIFAARQRRSFDFHKNGHLSRYMLLKEFNHAQDMAIPAGRLLHGIQFSTREVKVSVPIKGDISVKLAYRNECLSIDLGYNFYGNAEEKIKLLRRDNGPLVGIKGTEGTCGLEYQIVESQGARSFGPLEKKIPLNSTQSHATIKHGAQTDNPVPVASSNNDIVVTPFSRQMGQIMGNGVHEAKNSRPPIFVSENDLNIRSGRAGPTATHKVFGYFGYTFERWRDMYAPYIGIAGELELEALACNERSSLNQWSLFVKGGLQF